MKEYVLCEVRTGSVYHAEEEVQNFSAAVT